MSRWSANELLLLFSCLVVFNSLWPHGLQHTRLPCPSPSPRACSNSCPLSLWCHPIISSLCCLLLLLLSIFPSIGVFSSESGGQSIGASASASVFPMNIQCWFPLALTDLISLQSKRLSRVFSNTTVQSINSSALSLPHGIALTSVHDHWRNHRFE